MGQWRREDGTAGLTGPAVLFGFGEGMLGRGLNKLQSESLFEGIATGSRFPVKTCVHACLLMQLSCRTEAWRKVTELGHSRLLARP